MSPGPGDTIVAIASAPGVGDRAVIRVSGPIDPLTRSVRALPSARGIARVEIDLGDARLPCLALRFVAPASYTGEDGLELLIPGGSAVVARVLDAMLAVEGVRAAEPGEFSARAYLAGRLTIDEARGVEATIAAGNAEQLSAARRLLSGRLGDAARDWSDRLARLLALVEAGIDFADQEDVTAIDAGELRGALARLDAEIGRELGGAIGRETQAGVPRVLLVGPPSAGKSTLFNALLGRPRSVTDAEPGTTRDAITERVRLADGPEFELVDLPGLDGSPAAALASGLIRDADLLLLCDEHGRFDADLAAGAPALRVRTKADRPPLGAGESDLRVCALSGEGLEGLRSAIGSRLRAGSAGAVGLPWSVAGRLRGCRRALTDAADLAAERPAPAELIADRLRAALDELGAVTGRVDPDEVLGLVFSAFCVGK